MAFLRNHKLYSYWFPWESFSSRQNLHNLTYFFSNFSLHFYHEEECSTFPRNIGKYLSEYKELHWAHWCSGSRGGTQFECQPNSRSLQGNFWTLLRLSHDHFLTNPFQIHQSWIILSFDAVESKYGSVLKEATPSNTRRYIQKIATSVMGLHANVV
jgi:hypothetical protein